MDSQAVARGLRLEVIAQSAMPIFSGGRSSVGMHLTSLPSGVLISVPLHEQASTETFIAVVLEEGATESIFISLRLLGKETKQS